MLGSCRFSNHCQDHCFSKQVYALHLSYAYYLTNLHNSAPYRHNSTKLLWTPFPLIAHSTQNHIKKGKHLKWKFSLPNF